MNEVEVLVACLAMFHLKDVTTDVHKGKLRKYEKGLESFSTQESFPTTDEVVDYICEIFEKNLKGKQ